MQRFPAYYYHAAQAPRIVRNELELTALGPGWEDTPAKFAIPPQAELVIGQSDAGKEVIASRGDESRLKRKKVD